MRNFFAWLTSRWSAAVLRNFRLCNSSPSSESLKNLSKACFSCCPSAEPPSNILWVWIIWVFPLMVCERHLWWWGLKVEVKPLQRIQRPVVDPNFLTTDSIQEFSSPSGLDACSPWQRKQNCAYLLMLSAFLLFFFLFFFFTEVRSSPVLRPCAVSQLWFLSFVFWVFFVFPHFEMLQNLEFYWCT